MTTWDVFWFLFLFVPLCILWTMTLLDMIRRPDLVGWKKATWAMVIIFFPWIGVFAYLLLRPRDVLTAPYPGGSTPEAPMYAPQASPPAAPTQAASDGQGSDVATAARP
jgi:hypothetical protein